MIFKCTVGAGVGDYSSWGRGAPAPPKWFSHSCMMAARNEKRSISTILRENRGLNSLEVFFTLAFAQSTKGHARLYPFDIPMKLLYFPSFVLSLLFALFHFKVMRKSLCDVICEGAFQCVSDFGNTLAGTVFFFFNLFSLVWNN